MSGQRRGSPIFASAATLLLTATKASAAAQTPTISGNGWVALFILIGIVAIIYFVIMGALSIERRDARMGRSHSKRDDGWFGIFPISDPDRHGDGDANGN